MTQHTGAKIFESNFIFRIEYIKTVVTTHSTQGEEKKTSVPSQKVTARGPSTSILVPQVCGKMTPEEPGYDGTGSVIEIWNVVPGTLAFQLRTTHQKGVHDLVFSTDTLLVSAGGEDHVTQVCHIDTQAAKCSTLLQAWHLDTHTTLRSTPLLGRHAKITDYTAKGEWGTTKVK